MFLRLLKQISLAVTLIFICASAFGQVYDGTWSGTSSQGKTISFQVFGNAIPTLTIGGRISGSGCSTEFEQTVSWSSARPITNGAINITSNTSAPGGISFTFTGTFTSTSSASGSLTFKNNSIPGVPSCTGTGSSTWSATRAGGPPPAAGIDGIIPVVGSLVGDKGSFFKTTVQIHNHGTSTSSGKIVFHPANTQGQSTDPSINFSVDPMDTIDWEDLLPAMGLSGIGSADVVMQSGEMPVIIGRIYNDAGANGTSGMGFAVLTEDDALEAGDTSILLAPRDPTKMRLNIGVRTLDQGATMMIMVYDKYGNLRNSTTRNYSPNYFEQKSAAEITGVTLGASDCIAITLNSGSAIIYGAANDNTTNDPSLQMAKRTF